MSIKLSANHMLPRKRIPFLPPCPQYETSRRASAGERHCNLTNSTLVSNFIRMMVPLHLPRVFSSQPQEHNGGFLALSDIPKSSTGCTLKGHRNDPPLRCQQVHGCMSVCGNCERETEEEVHGDQRTRTSVGRRRD